MNPLFERIGSAPPTFVAGPNPFDPQQFLLWAITGCVFVVVIARWLTLPAHRRRFRAHVCAGCGYSKAGLESRNCPECGRQDAPR